MLAPSSDGILSRWTLRPALILHQHSRTLTEAVFVKQELTASTTSAASGSASTLRTPRITDQTAAVTKEGADRTIFQTLSVEVDSGADATLAVGFRGAGGTGNHTPVAHSLEAEVA